ncbi:hybrid sensor histidine kinase/response regulator [Flavobacterium sp. K5-23]|uniref:hybrid sensor histidine kinase/response regulator n=1 Tax=Flavobacterium sp. K5-23 TaxID=2746225 RepID=UPI002010658C|nr:hybrid sensor histidine kinase/response regulator [Flavobacterium sp. K5-23]UQD56713.1 hybrid sensor histidine kinase/response regulator [Flavobacterium sp. K5-23]
MKNGFSTYCTQYGVIKEIIHDGVGILVLDKSFLTLVEKSSMGKFFSFLKELNDKRSAIGWEVNFEFINNEYHTYYIAGIKNDNDTLTIIGSTENRSTRKFYEDLMLINNEQANNIRLLLKNDNKKDQSIKKTNKSFDELTKLNNEMANLQRELIRKNNLLDTANSKLEELDILKNNFLGMAAHDLRNPLSFIQNYSEILLNESSTIKEGEKEQILTDIHKSSLMMLSIVNDFLDVSKIESGKLDLNISKVDLIEIIKASIESNNFIALKKEIKLDFHSVMKSFIIDVDSNKILQILNNLISNAIKYSHSITNVDINCIMNENEILIEVIDQGQGIPSSELKNIFNAFTITSVKSTANEKSTGLGLSIVEKIVKAHGGECGVKSEVGVGSVFWFTIPFKDEQLNNNTVIEKVYEGNSYDCLNGKVVLIVDDDNLMRKLEERIFLNQNCEVLIACNGLEAIEIINKRDKIDFILMDYLMPIMNGIEATLEIRKKYSQYELPIFGLTGLSEVEVKNELIAAGMNDVLVKPIKKDQIIESLLKLVLNG